MDRALALDINNPEGFLALACLLAACYLYLNPQRRRGPRRIVQAPPQHGGTPPRMRRRRRALWCRSWLLRRPLFGQYEHLLHELHREDRRGYRKFVRFTPEVFGEMVERLTPLVGCQDTNMRPALPVGLKLAVTLRYLATGDDYTSLHYDFRVSVPSISRFVPKVLKAIIQVYKDEYLPSPRTPEAWKEVADGFSRRWNYHNCLGALDGKHVPIRRPPHAGSKFFNYKKFHSIILLALADSGLRFIYVDVGAEGGAGDAGTWNRCTLQQAIKSGALSQPDDTCLPHDDTPLPYHIVGDDAFSLQPWLMKPYSNRSQIPQQRLFSYRLSRARRVVENAFGVMQRKFKVFGVTQGILPATVRDVVTTCCILHNMVVTPAIQPAEIDHEDEDHNIVPGSWREGETLMADLAPARGNNPKNRAKAVRNYLANYYTSEVGAVPWQERLVYPRGRPQDAE